MRAENETGAERVVERLEVGPLATNCYILKSGEELAVIDPGGDAEEILRRVAELGGNVKTVVNTHGHIDHMAANQEVLAATGAELAIHQLDARMLVEPDGNLSTMMGMRVKSPPATRLLADGDEVVVGSERMKVLHTPGHTPGSVCLIAKEFAFTGDTLFLDSIGRMDFPGGSERKMQASLARLQAVLSRETMLYPGHGSTGTFGRALLVNPFLGSVWPA
uniref:MBL fold metallo-hydrolase n=1 Tax=candidate division WOR-3 bacterium TaxID=2052148 RepID=A0A7C4CEX5_UNCW3